MLTQPRGGEPPQPGASTGVTQPEPDGPAPGGSRALARNVGAWAFAVDPTPNFDVMTYWRILLKRRWLILSVIVASLLVGIGITLMMRPYYTSRATLQIIIAGAPFQSVIPASAKEAVMTVATQHCIRTITRINNIVATKAQDQLIMAINPGKLVGHAGAVDDADAVQNIQQSPLSAVSKADIEA